MPMLGRGGSTLHNVPWCWTDETAVALDTEILHELPNSDYSQSFGPGFNFTSVLSTWLTGTWTRSNSRCLGAWACCPGPLGSKHRRTSLRMLSQGKAASKRKTALTSAAPSDRLTNGWPMRRRFPVLRRRETVGARILPASRKPRESEQKMQKRKIPRRKKKSQKRRKPRNTQMWCKEVFFF